LNVAFEWRCHSYQSRLQVVIATRRTRRVEGGTHPRGGSDGTPDDHSNKQNRQAGNAWMLTARTRAARRLPQPRKRFDGLVWGLKDEFTLGSDLRIWMSNSCQQTCVFKFRIVFIRAKENVPPAFKQYKNQGNASNLVQSHFGSPPLRMLES